MRRRLIVVCGALAVAVTACGSPSTESGTTTVAGSTPAAGSAVTPTPTPTGIAPVTTRCTAAGLTGKVENTDAGAGNRYAKFVVTNTSAAQCTLTGYSGFQLLDAAGSPLPTALERVADPAPAPVTLAPGGSAAANLHWTVVPAGDETQDGPCRPEAANAAAIPPDETAPLTVAWGLGPVCGGGRIEISAFYAA
ncbi:DUF4232 domain-containing protein [Saccharothrix violaceirubra]|uniref:DUF4232 domain-containing protein n=1 Tax=Saccharothrix violaceirubra TaxID=413306 RepID=A0A7W7T8S5_9PSEU|nr:DUF4232 domain-containing protein [Saccharothrix violaceirubra]MBB4968677.1 hypothetical protein [Saccharothrix violaceirubra]